MSHVMKRRVTVLATMISVLLVASIAFAAWTSNGSGSGSAGSITSVDSVISSDDFTADLYPGADSTVDIEITNPNPYPVTILSVSGGSSDLVGSCAAGTVTSDALGESGDIAANSSEVLTIDTHMAADATDACKDQTFTLPLTATLESNAS